MKTVIKKEITIEEINSAFKEFMECETISKQKKYLKKYLAKIETK